MRQAGGGSIVNISSISGIIAIGAPAYNASKGAVRVFTKVTAVEHAKDKIRCNSIHPGPIDTAMLQSGHEDPEAAMQRRLSAIPLGGSAPEDIAYGALYLASDESSFVTGAELVIDGGFIARRALGLSFVTHVRYNCARTACAIPIPSSARLIGVERSGDDL